MELMYFRQGQRTMMRKGILACLILMSQFSLQIPAQEKTPDTLPPKFRKWVEEDVIHIITPLEKGVFLKLGSDRERDLFIEAFWKHRDPTPGTSENEFKKEHYTRISYANHNFGRSVPKTGWQTDRGRIYILLGNPDDIERFTNLPGIYNTEVWFYQRLAELGLPPGFQLVFFQKDGVGEYVLYSPTSNGPQSLLEAYMGDQADYLRAYREVKKINPSLAKTSLSLIPGEPARFGQPSLASDILIQNINHVPQRIFKDKYAEKFLMYKDIVEVDYSANYIDSNSIVRVIKDTSGFDFVHYIIEIKRLSVQQFQDKYVTHLKINGTVSDQEGKTIFQYEGDIPLEFSQDQLEKITYIPFNIYDMFPLLPGNYKLSVLLKNEVSKEFTSIERDIVIPYVESSLKISDLILAYKVEPGTSKNLRPFKLGNDQVFCQPLNIFKPLDVLFVYFQILGKDPDWKNEGLIRYDLFKENEKISTVTRKISDYQDRLSIKEEFSLKGLLPGYYRIDVHLTDGEGDYHSQNKRFEITAVSGFPRPWFYSKTLFPLTHPAFSFVLGQQYHNKGEMEKARIQFEKSYRINPDSLEYSLNLSRVYFRLKEFKKIKEILLPFGRASEPNYEVYLTLGKVHQNLSEWSQAISFYDQAISHFGANTIVLNSLGECYYRLGEKKQALSLWEKSLKINPDQPEIKARMDAIRIPE